MGVIEVVIAPEKDADNTFRIEVVRSAAGEASAMAHLDVTTMSAQHPHLQEALLASSSGARRTIPAPSGTVTPQHERPDGTSDPTEQR